MKVVYFDIGGVLVTDGFHKASALFSEKLGIDKQTIFDAYIKTDDFRYSAGIISRERWENLFEELKVDVDIDEYIEIWHSTFVPIEESIRIAKSLSKDYVVGCLSDQPLDILPYLDKIGVLKLFEIKIISSLVKHSKDENNFDIYELALKESGVNKDEILFIDNSMKNINKAEEFGFNTLLYENPDKLRDCLFKLRIMNKDKDS